VVLSSDELASMISSKAKRVKELQQINVILLIPILALVVG